MDGVREKLNLPPVRVENHFLFTRLCHASFFRSFWSMLWKRKMEYVARVLHSM